MTHYDTLGLSETASQDEIKKAYRSLASKNHPDKGGDNVKFQEIQEAYSILSDNKKRQMYDNDGNTIHNFFNNFNTFDFFNEGFNTNKKMSDSHHQINVSLDDIYNKITKKLKISKNILCKCMINCYQCNGNGVIVKQIQLGPFTQTHRLPCHTCNGNCKIKKESLKCEVCNDSGEYIESQIFEITLNPDIKKVILKGWGEQPKKDNDIPGDFIIIVNIEKHKFFEIKNTFDLKYNVNLTLKESLIGKLITIPFFDDHFIVDTKGFGIINPNKEYTIFEKGLNKNGNLHIRFIIEYPDIILKENDIVLLNSIDF